MKKSDLKNFDVVQLRNGEKYIFADGDYFVDEDYVIFNKEYTLLPLWLYDENLMHHKVKSEDIVAVYRTTAPMIWEREEKIKLTQFERLMLERILNTGYNFVARDSDESLYFFREKPFKKDNGFWFDGGYYEELPNFLGDLFQFVTWEQEEALSVEELLKNEII